MRAGNCKAQAALRRVDDASSVHHSATATVDEKSVIHPTSATATLQAKWIKPDMKTVNTL